MIDISTGGKHRLGLVKHSSVVMLLASGHDKMITQQDLLSCAMKTFDAEAMFIKINFEIST